MRKQLMQKYFQVLKTRYVNASKSTKVKKSSAIIYKSMAFTALAKYCHVQRSYKQLAKEKEREKKQEIFTTWFYELREAQIIKGYKQIKRRKDLNRLFDAWTRFC